MPILQNKLVMKSIEALHDEALSLMPDTASNRDVTAPPAVLHAAKPPQESKIDVPKDTSVATPTESAGDHDIMARIDHLLRKLDEVDDVAIKPLTDDGPQSNMDYTTGDDSQTATAHKLTTDNPTNTNSPVLSNAANYANGDAILDVAGDGIAKDTADKRFGETSDDASNHASDDMFADDQPGETTSANQTQALADIAKAIYQSQQQSLDTVTPDASQNSSGTFDMDLLSATVADQVQRTVSAVIAAELPEMVREAVGEAFRALPANSRGQLTATAGNPSTTKSVAARKTGTSKKAVAKKTGTKKSATKKAARKTTPKKELSTRKAVAKKTAKKTAP